MKSSGTIELFKSQTARDVEKYDRFCGVMNALDETNRNIYIEVRKSRVQIFDFKYNELQTKFFKKTEHPSARQGLIRL